MGSSVVSFADESLEQPDKKEIAINEKKKYFILIRIPPFHNKSLISNYSFIYGYQTNLLL